MFENATTTASDSAGGRGYLVSVGVLIAATVAIVPLTYAGLLPAPDSSFYSENGLIEDLQALVLALGALMFAGQALSRRGAARSFAWGLAALSMTLCWRELDLRGGFAPNWLIRLTYEPGRTVVIVCISLVFAVYAFRHLHQWREGLALFLAPRTLAYVGAGVLLVLAGIAEHSKTLQGYHVVLEEWLELDGFVQLILAGIYFPYLPRRTFIR